MTCEMNKVDVLDATGDVVYRSMVRDGSHATVTLARLCCVADRCQLALHKPQSLHCTQSTSIFSNCKYVEPAGSSLWRFVLCVEQRRQGRSVRRHHIVRAAYSTVLGSVVDARCVDRKERKVVRWTPVQPRLCPA
jgi:hypothetical protein